MTAPGEAPVAKTRDEWIGAATRIIDDLRHILAPYGIALAADLRVVADPHPCPGYLHDARTIAFCPPVVEGAVDRARWLFFSRMMGCASLDEACSFYAVALPLVICHEASHHLRMTRDVASPSHFVEEQVCDRMAVAMVESMPHHRSTLEPLRSACDRMVIQLAESFGASPGAAFVPDVGDLLAATARVGRAELEQLERLATRRDIPLDALLTLSSGATTGVASKARELARQRVDTRYTDNPAEYWHLGLTWVRSYLSRRVHPSLADVLQEHLLTHDERRRESEVEGTLRVMLSESAHRAAAAEGLLVLRGEAVVAEIATYAHDADDVLAALVRMWPARGSSWDGGLVADLLDSSAVDPERARLLLRLAGKCSRARPEAHAPPNAPALAIELAAAARATEPQTLRTFLDDPLHATSLLEAWEAHGRELDELPRAALEDLVGRPTPPRTRRAILRLALDSSDDVWELVAPLAIAELADPSGLRTDENDANRVAHALLDRLGTEVVSTIAQHALPARGGPVWDELLALLAKRGGLVELGAGARLDVRLRAAAARADLEGVPTAEAVAVRALAEELLLRADALLAFAASLDASPGASVAREVLVMEARRAAIDVVQALAPGQASPVLASVAAEAARPGPVDDVVRDVLVGSAEPPLRERLARALAGVASDHAPSAPLDPTTLPPLVITALHAHEDPMLTTIEKLVQLRTVPLFAGIALEQLQEVAALAVVQTFEKGTTIFREEDAGDQLFLVLMGQVAIEKETRDDGNITLDRLGPSSCFGEMALFDGTPRSATARAVTDCRLLTLSNASIARIGRADPQIYEWFLRVLSTRLREANASVARRVNDRTSLL